MSQQAPNNIQFIVIITQKIEIKSHLNDTFIVTFWRNYKTKKYVAFTIQIIK